MFFPILVLELKVLYSMNYKKHIDWFTKNTKNNKLTFSIIFSLTLLIVSGTIWLVLTTLTDKNQNELSQSSSPQKVEPKKSTSPPFANFKRKSPPQVKSETTIENIALSVTVKVLADKNQGSGFLIANQDNKYWVITNSHVTNLTTTYQIKTPDQKIHTARLIVQDDSENGNDLAILEFDSSENYSLVNLADVETQQNLENGQTVFVAGFPLGSDKMSFSEGKISYITTKALKGGYQIGYTNETNLGMSGSPVFNQEGKVIAIHGTGAFPVLKNAYVYQDGLLPSDELIEIMEKLSFAIPIEKINQLDTPMIVGSQFNEQNPNIPRVEPSNDSLAKLQDKLETTSQDFLVTVNLQEEVPLLGMIIAKQANQYYLVTPKINTQKEKITITTNDQKSHDITLVEDFTGVNLQLWSFTSNNNNYTQASFNKYDFETADSQVIFSYGLPPREINSKTQFSLQPGLIFSESFSIFHNGYDLATTSLNRVTIPGSPIIDQQGRVIGIYLDSQLVLQQDNSSQELIINNLSTSSLLSLLAKTNIAENLLTVDLSPFTPIISQNEISLATPLVDSSAEEWLIYGNQLLSVLNFPEAILAFDQAIKLKPDLAKAYYGKALAYQGQKNYTAALVSIEKAIQLDSENSTSWREKGTILLKIGSLQAALSSYQQAIILNPQDSQLYLLKGLTLKKLQKYSEAENALTEAINLNPSSVAYMYRGRVKIKYKAYQEAIADCNQAIKLQPNLAEGYLCRGMVYHYQQEYPQALSDYYQVVALNPKLVEANFNIGLVEYEEGLTESALLRWQAIQSGDNFNSEMVQLAIAITLYHQEKKDQGLSLAETALKLEPELSNFDYLAAHLWGDQLLQDFQNLLTNQKIKASNQAIANFQ